MNKRMIVTKERAIAGTFITALLFLCCSCTQRFQTDHNNYIEAHRELVLSQFLDAADDHTWFDALFNVKKMPLPDSLEGTAIGDYIREHPELPGYIQNALIKKTPMLMMTIQEFLLIYENDVTKFLARISPYNEIDVTDRWVTQDSKIYFEANYWIFKYGFLWDWGKS